jgi:hypothetical protein
MAKYNIATVCYPTNFDAFLKCIRDALQPEDKLLGYVVVEGPGCYNHGVMVEGPTSEALIHSITLALQPGKYSLTSDSDPAVNEGAFTCCPRANQS